MCEFQRPIVIVYCNKLTVLWPPPPHTHTHTGWHATKNREKKGLKWPSLRPCSSTRGWITSPPRKNDGSRVYNGLHTYYAYLHFHLQGMNCWCHRNWSVWCRDSVRHLGTTSVKPDPSNPKHVHSENETIQNVPLLATTNLGGGGFNNNEKC